MSTPTTTFVDGSTVTSAAWFNDVDARMYDDVQNVKSWGALGNGVADDTAAINLAIAALSSGGMLYFPAGSYKTTGGHVISVNNVRIVGAGKTTSIYATHATNDIFSISSSYVGISHLTISFTTVRTAGSYINITGGNIFLNDLLLWGYFKGVNINNTGSSIIDLNQLNFTAGVAGSVGVDIIGGVDISIRSSIWQAAVGTPTAGIRVKNVGDLNLHDLNIIGQGTDLLINPGAGQAVFSIYATNCFFDTAATGMQIAPTTTGSVVRSVFNTCWFSSHTGSGCVVDGSGTSGGGVVSGIDFLNCQFFANTLSGLIVATASHINVIGGQASQNGNSGIVFNDAGCVDFSVTKVDAGAGGNFSGNTGYGVNIVNAAADRFRIIGNNMQSNSIGPILNASTALNWIVSNNLPYAANDTTRAKNFVSDAAPSAAWNLDGSGINSPITMLNGGTYDLAVGSGMVIVTFVTGGETAIYICGGGVTALVAQTSTSFVNGAPGAGKFGFLFNGTTAYRLSNNIGSTKTVKVVTLRTRETA